MMTGPFHIPLSEGTLHVNKIQVWFKIENITHELPVPVYRQTDFVPKRVVVSRLHDTIARFRTGVKFSPRYKNRGELTPRSDSRRHEILWWYHINKYRAMRGNRSKVAHVNTPLPNNRTSSQKRLNCLLLKFFWPISEEKLPIDSCVFLHNLVFLIDRHSCVARSTGKVSRGKFQNKMLTTRKNYNL